MPELPEVETSRRLIERHCCGRVITEVITKECGGGPRDGRFDGTVIGDGVGEARLVSSLRGRRMLRARRRGKQLWVELSGRGPALLLHLGMTGSIHVEGASGVVYRRHRDDGQWPPRFTKLLLGLRGGKRLAFADPRRFGRILLRESPEEHPPLSALAPDPITDPLPLQDFASGLAASKLPVKALLLNQERVVSGVGNWMADEVLYRAAVHPAAQACELSEASVKAIYVALLAICKKACAVSADHKRFPRSWLFHYRWGKGRSALELSGGEGKPHAAALPDGRAIRFSTVGGRTTAYVPAVQGETPAQRTNGRKPRGTAMKRLALKRPSTATGKRQRSE